MIALECGESIDFIDGGEENKVENVEKEIENASLVEVTNKLDGSM
ncbi:MAG: hypothetical protein ACRC6T_08805 [Sarcina sp.]